MNEHGISEPQLRVHLAGQGRAGQRLSADPHPSGLGIGALWRDNAGLWNMFPPAPQAKKPRQFSAQRDAAGTIPFIAVLSRANSRNLRSER